MRGFMKYACVLALPLLVAAGAAQAQTWPDGGNRPKVPPCMIAVSPVIR